MILVCNMRTLHSRKHYYLPSTGGRIFHFCSVELTTVAEPHSGSVGGPSSVPQAVGQQRQSDALHKPIESRAVCRDASVVLFPRRACPQGDFAMSESIASQPARPHYPTPFAVASQLTSRPSTQAEAMRLETLPDTP